MSDGRNIELSVEVPGTVEEVWNAIATGPGITSWYVPTELDEHEGGAVSQHFGDMGTVAGRVLVWDAPHRVVFEGGAETGRPLAFEWTVEAASGDTCTVRLVNSGFGAGEDWDAEFDGMSSGWLLFLENLRLHLTHFRAQRATAAIPVAMLQGPNARAWSTACAAFGLTDRLAAGVAVQLEVSDSVTWPGVVERVLESPAARGCVVRLHDPRATGFLAAEGNGDEVAVSGWLYLYGEGADEHAAEWDRAWTARLKEG